MIKLDKIDISRFQPILAQIPQWRRQRALVILPILALVWMAQNAFDNLSDMGYLWLGLAGLLLWAALPRPLFPPRVETPHAINLTSGRRLQVGGALALLALVFALYSAGTFLSVNMPEEAPGRTPWTFFKWTLALAIAGGLLMTRASSANRWWRGLTWGFFVILGLGIVLRLYNYNVQPFGVWVDETDTAMWAREMMQHKDFRPVYFYKNHLISLVTLYGVMLQEFGITYVGASRLVSVLFGVGSLIGGYAVGKEVSDNRLGLLFAFFLAVMRWSLDFSRIAMTGIDTVFFVTWAAYFVLRAGRTGALRDAMWAGLLLGASMWFYNGIRPPVVSIAAVLVVLLLRSRLNWRAIGAVLLTVIFYGTLVLYPLLIYLYQDFDGWNERQKEVSIFEGGAGYQEGVPLTDVIQESMRRNARMFNMPGDRNGRHNLAGEPMIDPVMGWLLGLGVVLLVLNIWRGENLVFGLSMLVALLTASITIPWEQPNGIRGIAVMPGIAYCCALGAYGIMRLSDGSSFRGLFQVGGVLGLIVVTGWNSFLFFEPQRREWNNWASYDMEYTLAGLQARHFTANQLVYVSQNLAHHTLHFLAPDTWTLMKPLPTTMPLPIAPDRPITFILLPIDDSYLERIIAAYPNGDYDEVTPEDFGLWPSNEPVIPRVLLTIVELTPEVIRDTQGLNSDGTGALYVPKYGEYTFSIPPGTTALLDGQPIVNEQRVRQLAEGFHSVEIHGDGVIGWLGPNDVIPQPIPNEYLFKNQAASNGLRFSMAPGEQYIAEQELYARIDQQINSRVHIVPIGTPVIQRWSGSIWVPEAGEYTLFMEDNDDANIEPDVVQFYIEGRELNPQGETLTLEARPYAIDIYLYDTIKSAQPSLYWTPPGKVGFELVPQDVLRPYWP